MILLIDNYDSFVFNLARYFRELGEDVEVVRNDRIGPEEVENLGPTHLVISPGPCTPSEAGQSTELVRRLGSRLPTLGVCLGHQCIGEAYGARVMRAARPVHGKVGRVHHDGDGVMCGLPSPIEVTRYHSLVVDPPSVPAALVVGALSDDGEIMALRHVDHPVWGVQFHPEAACTSYGHAILANFLALGRGQPALGAAGGGTTSDPTSGQFGASFPAARSR